MTKKIKIKSKPKKPVPKKTCKISVYKDSLCFIDNTLDGLIESLEEIRDRYPGVELQVEYDFSDDHYWGRESSFEIFYHGPELDEFYKRRLDEYNNKLAAYNKWYEENKKVIEEELKRRQEETERKEKEAAAKKVKKLERELERERKKLNG